MRVWLSLGSNLGDRAGHLADALLRLNTVPQVSVQAVSSVHETQAMGEREQPAFLNLAAEIETELTPLELLKAVKEVETAMGRQPTYRWGPRVIDIDLILWGTHTCDTPVLTLPHREFRNRAFVLAPLAEIAPDAIDPVTGKSVAQLARQVCRRDALNH
jgi:2-amino-4-hydroxy-6-hydroxymethyldihydropteridine diphosphokinase